MTTKLYRKKGLIAADPWHGNFDLAGVTINPKDQENGSPKVGDMIAHDPKNPTDTWLISKEYFEANYEDAA